MTRFTTYQLAPDHATYGADAGKFIVTGDDLEREFSGPMGGDDARTLASALNACHAVVDRWERGDLAEAARLCAAVVEDVTERDQTTTHDDIRRNHFARLNAYANSAEYAEYARSIGAEVPPGDLPPLIGNRWEIDREIYNEFLEMLPPLGWRGGAFYMSEFSFDDITAKFSREGDKYYCEFARYPERHVDRVARDGGGRGV